MFPSDGLTEEAEVEIALQVTHSITPKYKHYSISHLLVMRSLVSLRVRGTWKSPVPLPSPPRFQTWGICKDPLEAIARLFSLSLFSSESGTANGVKKWSRIVLQAKPSVSPSKLRHARLTRRVQCF